jgi:hypothetical protein
MIIYKATNTINGKCYVGQTKYTLRKRKASHIRSAYHASKRRTYFLWALREYGEDSFAWEVLAECPNQKELDRKEQYFIEKFSSNNPDHGYNSIEGGQGSPHSSKLRRFLKNRKRGVVLTSRSLLADGFSRKLLNWYMRSNWLEGIGHGAFIFKGDHVEWDGALYAVQLDLPSVHVGGLASTSVIGTEYSFPKTKLLLFGDPGISLPKWFTKRWGSRFMCRTTDFLPPFLGLQYVDRGDFKIAVSTNMRAFLEDLKSVSDTDSFNSTYNLFREQRSTNAPLLQSLLESCKSIKVKRLALFMIKKSNPQLLMQLRPQDIELGSGKRQIVRNGRYDSEFQITIPANIEEGEPTTG